MSDDPADPCPPCPDCGYDRRGLGDARPCPECGAVPEAGVAVFYGRGRAASGGQLALSLTVAAAVLMAASAALSGLQSRGYGVPAWPFLAGALLAAAGVGRAVLRARAAETGRERGGPVQLRVSDAGYTTRVGYGPVRWRRWPRRVRARVEGGGLRRARVVAERPSFGLPVWWVSVEAFLSFAPDGGKAATRELAAEIERRAGGGR